MIYLDSSALLKLILRESETESLRAWLTVRDELPRTSSELMKVEVLRAVRRFAPHSESIARELVSQVDLIPITGRVIAEAAVVGEPTLRSLDAIHLASALSIRDDLTAFIAYDHRLADAARTNGLAVELPR